MHCALEFDRCQKANPGHWVWQNRPRRPLEEQALKACPAEPSHATCIGVCYMSATMSFDVSSVFSMAISEIQCLDADIRSLECIHGTDAHCLTDGFEELFCDDTDIDKDVCITDGLVELGCLDGAGRMSRVWPCTRWGLTHRWCRSTLMSRCAHSTSSLHLSRWWRLSHRWLCSSLMSWCGCSWCRLCR